MEGASLFRVKDLIVRYRRLVALKVDELTVPLGKTLIIGPNGSGKTTLIKALLGLLKPSHGFVEILGMDPLKNSRELSRRVTYVRDIDEIPDNIRVSTLIDTLRGSFGDNVVKAAEELGLLDHQDKRLGELSRGMRRKASLLVALASTKDLIVIDEPFSGLDRMSRDKVSRLLDEKSTNMLIISHIPPRIRFDYLVVVESARITYSGPYKEIDWYGY